LYFGKLLHYDDMWSYSIVVYIRNENTLFCWHREVKPLLSR